MDVKVRAERDKMTKMVNRTSDDDPLKAIVDILT